MTDARPTSEPVPAVVGTATTGAMPRGIDTRVPVLAVLEIPDRARLADHQRDRLAGVERAAAAEGDDAVMRPAPKRIDARRDVGLDRIRLHVREHFAGRPDVAARLHRVRDHRQAASAGSVTSSGRCMPSARHASGSSAMRPAPKRIEVG